MLLEVIIVSYNTAGLLKDCLSSLFDNLKYDKLAKNSVVTVVDNASSDESVAMTKKHFPLVNIISSGKNIGFAAANNLAVGKSKAKYILFLNSDTVLHRQAVSGLIRTVEKNSQIWVTGPKLSNSDGSLQQSFGFSPDLFRIFCWMFFLDDLPVISKFVRPYHASRREWYQDQHEVGWVKGAALLFRRDAVKSAGLLDEKIFMYGEEVEWCFRITERGGKIIFDPQSEITHIGGGSQKGPESAIIGEYRFIIYFFRKYHPGQFTQVRFLLKCGALLRLILFGIIGRFPEASIYAKALKMVR